MAREKMDWRGHGGFFAQNAAGELMPTDADGNFLPVDEDGYLLAPNPTYSQSGSLPPLSSQVPKDVVLEPAPSTARPRFITPAATEE